MTILAQQVSVKLFARRPLSQEPLIPIFHRWIREDLVPDHLLIDVADYRHVPRGPGVMLIAHQAHLWLDEAEPAQGLVYGRRRDPLGDVDGKIEDALRGAVRSAVLLESEDGYGGGFEPNHFEIQIRSRLSTTQDYQHSVSALADTTDQLVGRVWGEAPELELGGDPRRPVTVRVRAPERFAGVLELADHLSVAPSRRKSLSVLA